MSEQLEEDAKQEKEQKEKERQEWLKVAQEDRLYRYKIPGWGLDTELPYYPHHHSFLMQN